jgi:hypothetical protein
MNNVERCIHCPTHGERAGGGDRFPVARSAVRIVPRPASPLNHETLLPVGIDAGVLALQEPQEGLPHGPQRDELGEHQAHRSLHPAIRILLQPSRSGLEIAGRAGHNQFAPARLRPPGVHRPLAQQVQLILVQAPLQPQPQSIVAVPGGVHGVLVDQHGIDHLADFDQLLPIPTVAGKARDLPRRHLAHLAQTDFRHHGPAVPRVPRIPDFSRLDPMGV